MNPNIAGEAESLLACPQVPLLLPFPGQASAGVWYVYFWSSFFPNIGWQMTTFVEPSRVNHNTAGTDAERCLGSKAAGSEQN